MTAAKQIYKQKCASKNKNF